MEILLLPLTLRLYLNNKEAAKARQTNLLYFSKQMIRVIFEAILSRQTRRSRI